MTIDVRNDSTETYHVWASRRSYDYDPATRTLTVYLADVLRQMPQSEGIVPISYHPRTPAQVAVPAGQTATITVAVPTAVRTLSSVPGQLGLRVDERPIGPVERVECYLTYADVPYQPTGDLPSHVKARQLREWGTTLHETRPNDLNPPAEPTAPDAQEQE
ncbi:hypothetical protein [Rugosimonospora acidiphila]|uniref:hypothetical protein n=1 Tax=Rugosimonospora acidiphila TaxID=556531 RepID=UPI0031ED8BB0